MDPWFHHVAFLGNSVHDWIVAGIGALIGYIVVYGIARLLAARLKSISEHHPRNMLLSMSAAVIRATRGWVLLLLAIVIALHTLSFGPHIDDHMRWLIGKTGTVNGLLSWLITIFITIQIGFWVSTLIVAWLRRATPDGSMQKTNPIIYGILTWAVEVMVWVTLALVLLASAGAHIGAFIASLGVGGIAIALAAKNVLEDLFASLAIGLDKPFVVGEFIMFGSELGTVKKVGIKSTRIESLSGEELAISNSILLQNLVHNYSRRQERRIVFGFHIPLDTPRDKVEQVTNLVNGIIDEQENTRRDRGFMEAIEPQGFRYEFVYYVLTPDYNDYVAAQQAINLKILDAMEATDANFAMPMRMMYGAHQEPGAPETAPVSG